MNNDYRWLVTSWFCAIQSSFKKVAVAHLNEEFTCCKELDCASQNPAFGPLLSQLSLVHPPNSFLANHQSPKWSFVLLYLILWVFSCYWLNKPSPTYSRHPNCKHQFFFMLLVSYHRTCQISKSWNNIYVIYCERYYSA